MKLKIVILCILITSSFVRSQSLETKNTPIEDNIVYTASLDDKHVYISLNTTDKNTMRSMLHRGFTVYFDEKGKKKKYVYVKYPAKVEASKRTKPNRGENGGQNRDEKEEKPKEPNIQEIITNLPRVAEYKNYDVTNEFNLDINSIGVSIDYHFRVNEEGGTLEYLLKIPKKKISSTGNLKKLSIGVVSAKKEKKEGDKPSVSIGGGGASGNGGPPGGGRSGGGGPPGGGRGGNSIENPKHDNNTTKENEINFWFKLNPKK